jgi:RNA polymerase sigma-70 factor, ECF subfamily
MRVGVHPSDVTNNLLIERLFVEDSARMWRAVLAYTGDREIASDSVAEAFTLALESQERIASASGWLWRVAFRIATAELRRRGRTTGELSDLGYVPEDPAAEMLSALRRLSPRQRGAIVLHYYADRPVDEVARILGSTGPAVRVHLMRGRRKLKELLEESDG